MMLMGTYKLGTPRDIVALDKSPRYHLKNDPGLVVIKCRSETALVSEYSFSGHNLFDSKKELC